MARRRVKHKKALDLDSRDEARSAFERVSERLAALDGARISKLSLGVSKTVVVVLAAHPRIAKLVPELKERIVDFPAEKVDELRDLALAAWYARQAPLPVEQEKSVKQLVDEGMTLRRTLLLEAEALAALGLLRQSQVDALRGGRGHLNLADGLLSLKRLYRESWRAIAAKTAVTTDHLERAEKIGIELMQALGGNEVLQRGRARDVENRAMTLLVQTYDELRAAVVYVRWKQRDADKIAPSLYAGRGRRRMVSDQKLPQSDPATPVSTSATPPATAAPGSGAAATP